jgi:hypothetical protein
MHTCIANYRVFDLRQYRDRTSFRYIMRPISHDGWVGDVHSQEEQIIFEQIASELKKPVLVFRAHQSQDNFSSFKCFRIDGAQRPRTCLGKSDAFRETSADFDVQCHGNVLPEL